MRLRGPLSIITDHDHTGALTGQPAAIIGPGKGGRVGMLQAIRTRAGGIVVKTRNPSFESRTLSADQAKLIKVLGRVIWAGGLI